MFDDFEAIFIAIGLRLYFILFCVCLKFVCCGVCVLGVFFVCFVGFTDASAAVASSVAITITLPLLFFSFKPQKREGKKIWLDIVVFVLHWIFVKFNIFSSLWILFHSFICLLMRWLVCSLARSNVCGPITRDISLAISNVLSTHFNVCRRVCCHMANQMII